MVGGPAREPVRKSVPEVLEAYETSDGRAAHALGESSTSARVRIAAGMIASTCGREVEPRFADRVRALSRDWRSGRGHPQRLGDRVRLSAQRNADTWRRRCSPRARRVRSASGRGRRG